MASEADFIIFFKLDSRIEFDPAPLSISLAYKLAVAETPRYLSGISPIIYNLAIYNLATHYMVMMAPDEGANDYRQANNLNVIITPNSSFSDNGTGGSLLTGAGIGQLSVADQSKMLTPWGRNYLQMVPARPPVVRAGVLMSGKLNIGVYVYPYAEGMETKPMDTGIAADEMEKKFGLFSLFSDIKEKEIDQGSRRVYC